MAGGVDIRYRGAPQPVIGEVLRLRDENGGTLTERLLVDAASDPTSPLHALFEWDNERAGDGFRVIQARLLINRVKITISEGEQLRVMPAFVSITDGAGKRVRVGSERALANPDLLAQVLAETRQQLNGLRNRLSAFDQTAGVVEALDGVIERLPPS